MPVISKITGAPFRFWCQKVLPAVYDDSLSYYELLCKVVDYLNKVMEDDINVVNLVNELEEFVNNYFDNLDVQEEINNKLDAMAEEGTLYEIIAPHLDEIMGQYEATLDADLAEYKDTINTDIAEFKLTVNGELDAQDTDITNFKNTVNEQVSAQNTEIANFKSTINTRMSGQDSDITNFKNTVNEQVSAQNTEIANFKSTINTRMSGQDSDISVMQSQLSNFLSSETPDANTELLDIRVGANGITYSTAGNAVRGQYSDLNNTIGELTPTPIESTYAEAFTDGSFSNPTVGQTLAFTSTTAWKHSYFDVTPGDKVYPTMSVLTSTTNIYGVFTDDNSIVISIPYIGSDVNGMKSFRPVIVPTGATRLYFIVYADRGNSYLTKLVYSDIQTEIDTLNTTKANASDLVLSNEGKKRADCTVNMVQGTVNIDTTNKVISVTPSQTQCYAYVPVIAGIPAYIHVPYNYSVMAYRLDSNTGTYRTIGQITNAFTPGPTTITATLSEAHTFILVRVIKKSNGYITPEEANNITVYQIIDNEFKQSMDSDITHLENEVYNLGEREFMCIPSVGQIVYNGDTKSSNSYIENAISYNDGIIIGARSNGKLVRIGYDDTEETLLSLNGSNMDWRCLWMDSSENVYASPHASLGNMNMSDRGLYRLAKGASTFVKVLSLYDTESSVPTETQTNDDTIWTMCEDDSGNLYAGVYAHTVRENPAIYKSTDGGNTWTYFFNFNTEGLTNNGMHIHSIIYSKWKKALYCIVGEINTIFKSINGGSTWVNLNVTLTTKGSAMCATENGIFIGSDGARNCDIDVLFNDDTTHTRVYHGWANTVFAIRRSDETGFLYAFTKVDSSVNVKNSGGYTYLYPPNSVFDEPNLWDAINEWKTHISQTQYDDWYNYYQSVINTYPDDAVRPRHCAILVSRDGGKRWEVLKALPLAVNPSTGNTFIDGLWTTGYFFNGECLTGRVANGTVTKPLVISEGKHRYVSDGCDLDGEVFVRTNTSSVVTVL